MDFKSTIFIFGAALIFILPLVISSPISGEGGGGGGKSMGNRNETYYLNIIYHIPLYSNSNNIFWNIDRSSLTNSSNFTNQMQVKNTTETSLNVADNSNDTDEIGINGF